MSATKRFSAEEVVAIHDVAVRRFGGAYGIRDYGLLESALAQPWQTFGGEELYRTDVEKACRLAYGIIRNHPFVDGNKRTGAAMLGVMLRMSGIAFQPDHTEFLAAMLEAAAGSMNFDALVSWVKFAIEHD